MRIFLNTSRFAINAGFAFSVALAGCNSSPAPTAPAPAKVSPSPKPDAGNTSANNTSIPTLAPSGAMTPSASPAPTLPPATPIAPTTPTTPSTPNTPNTPNTPTTSPAPNQPVVPQAQVTPPPAVTPPVPSAPLPATMATSIALTDSTGAKVTLADRFTTPWVFLTVSQSDCNACIASVRMFESADVQRLFTTGKCTQVNVVQGSLDIWKTYLGADTLKHTYAPADQTSGAAQIPSVLGVNGAILPLGVMLQKNTDGTYTKLTDTANLGLTPRFIDTLKQYCGP